MKNKTYLQESLNKGRIVRWQASQMPITVYIAPFAWYKSKNLQESYKYQQMVINALQEWQNASGGLISFVLVQTLYDSVINLSWKRVDRKSLGQCYFNYNTNALLYSAEIQIGLSDGIIHRQYMDKNEVYHTILHEIGHALGLGHSDNKEDIMYTPHQYGIVAISANDVKTLKWLYKFDIGLSEPEILAKFSMTPALDIDDLVYKLTNQKSEFEKVKDSITAQEKRDLIEESENIGELKKYLLELNKINIKFKKPEDD